MTTFKISNVTTKAGQIAEVKVRLLASGGEAALKCTFGWNPEMLRFEEAKLGQVPENTAIGTNMQNLSQGHLTVLINPTPVPFEKSKAYMDVLTLKFRCVGIGRSPVAFSVPEGYENDNFAWWNNVSHILNGAQLRAKWLNGRVTVK